MKLVKALGIVALVLAVLAGGIWHFWGKDLAESAKIGAAFGAKHVCSCLHVAERTMESCQSDFVGDDFEAFSFEDDGSVTTVTAPYRLGSAEAKFEPGLGCALIKPSS